jgi:hypothetical protein
MATLSSLTPPSNVTTATNTQTMSNKTLTSPTVNSATLNTPTVTGYTESLAAIGTVTTSYTLVITSGTVLTATLTAGTACTFTMPTATAGKSFMLILTQAAAGSNGSATFTGVKWPGGTVPTVTATLSAVDIFAFVANGTSWYGSYQQAYA